MIPSLDTYVHNKLETTVKAILDNRDILEETLKDIDKTAKDNFIKTYGGKSSKREVNVTYSFPDGREGFDALYLVQLGGSSPSRDSLGSVEGTFDSHEGELYKETAEIKADFPKSKLYIKAAKPIAELVGVEGISFATSDNVFVQEDHITFELLGNESLEGIEVTFTYTEKLKPGEASGVQKGYTLTEAVVITPLSTNLDTLRCMDAILKVVLIIMRESIEEQTMFGLQKSVFEPVNVLDIPTETPVYGRPLTLTYQLSYSIELEFGKRLKEINIRKRLG